MTQIITPRQCSIYQIRLSLASFLFVLVSVAVVSQDDVSLNKMKKKELSLYSELF